MSDDNISEQNSLDAFPMDNENDCCWKGNTMEEIYRSINEWELSHFPPIINRRDHIVLFELPINLNSTEPPKPHKGHSKWDSNHVRMPCSSQNEYLVSDESDPSATVKIKRWEIIQNALLQPILSSYDLEKAILTYNTKYARQWKFHALHELFEQELDETESSAFFTETLPEIIRLALRLPELIPNAIPLLKHGSSKSVSLSQQQVACLLANAFLCTFPRRNAYNRSSEYRNFPSINFNSLFQNRNDRVLEKIKCICYYFRAVCKKMPLGVITFARRTKNPSDFPDWNTCTASFNDRSMVHISSEGTIEDNGSGLLQVDFANKFIGGGVLNSGCVQEEIRFVICPELLCSLLFTEVLAINECLIIMGCERFNSYSGYASTFKWTGGYEDSTPFDMHRRRKCCVVAIDAICFRDQTHQYQEELMKRELNKAFVGFYHELNTPAPGVATGNWGCGAFNGDKSLKSLLQLMVCCVTNRPLVYYTFGDTELRDDFYYMFQYLTRNEIKIAELWNYLKKFKQHKLPAQHLYPFIMQCHRDASHAQVTNSTDSFQRNSPTINAATVVNDTTISPIIPWPPSDDDDIVDQLLLKEVQKTENNLLKQLKLNNSSTVTSKRKQHSADENGSTSVDGILKQADSELMIIESKEKRHRSLLDCLDQNYYTEMPSKIERNVGLTEAKLSITNLPKATEPQTEQFDPSKDCVIEIDNDSNSVDRKSETSEQIKSIIDMETDANLMNQTDKLESLQVGSDGEENSKTENVIELLDVIPCTPPSNKSFTTIKSANHKTLLDYFKKN